MGGASVPLILLRKERIMGAHNEQQKKARQLSEKQIIKTATATLTRKEVLEAGLILANSASANTQTMPATDTELAGVSGYIGNKGAGLLTVAFTSTAGASTATFAQGLGTSYRYDEDGKCYLV
jgi:hypothetical protein